MKPTTRQKVILELVMDASTHQLTPRQTQILMLIIRGKTNAEIATTLNISINTVKVHISRILPKTKAKSKAQIFATILDRLVGFR